MIDVPLLAADELVGFLVATFEELSVSSLLVASVVVTSSDT